MEIVQVQQCKTTWGLSELGFYMNNQINWLWMNIYDVNSFRSQSLQFVTLFDYTYIYLKLYVPWQGIPTALELEVVYFGLFELFRGTHFNLFAKKIKKRPDLLQKLIALSNTHIYVTENRISNLQPNQNNEVISINCFFFFCSISCLCSITLFVFDWHWKMLEFHLIVRMQKQKKKKIDCTTILIT